MKFISIFVLTFVFLIGKGFAEKNSPNNFMIRIAPEQLEVSENGMFLLTEIFEKIPISQLQFDEEGFFTTFEFSFACQNCQTRFDIHPLVCDQCESTDLELISLGKNDNSSLYFLNSMFLEILNNYSFNNENLLCLQGSVGVGASADTDGNASVDFRIKGKTDDGAFSWIGSVEINQDGKGETNGKAEGRIELEF